MIDRWRRLLRRTRPDVRWYWDIRCKTVPPGESRSILRWPVCEWHQQTSVNRKQTLLTFLSYTSKPSITSSSVSPTSGQNRSSPTSLPHQWHSTSCKPAQQHMRWHVNKSAFAWEMCLRFLAGAWTSLHHAHIYTLTQRSVWYIVYTHAYIVHIHITNVPLQVISNTDVTQICSVYS